MSYLSKYEVTQGQWQKIMGMNPSKVQDNLNLPVENVSWEDVQEFIRQLNVKEGSGHYRLPTEAEWEYAARGSDGRIYPWKGDFDPERLKFCDPNCQSWWKWPFGKKTTTAPVGSYPNGQSPFGVHDMAGNVWEWVQDWFGPYTADAALNPAGPSSGVERVCRGGGWRDQAEEFFRMTHRRRCPPRDRSDDRGFRLFRDIRQP